MSGDGRPSISALVLAHNRRESVAKVIQHLQPLGLDEVIVADNASEDGTREMLAERFPDVRLVDTGGNVGVAGRNRGAEAATSELLLLVDDDSYPLPGALESLLDAIASDPRIGVVGGLMHDRDGRGGRIPDGAIGTFDWWLRAGQDGDAPPGGFPSPFFPECGCLMRREAMLSVGGFCEPFFFHLSEPDLAIRLLAAGWDVRYLPAAEFEHEKTPRDDDYAKRHLRHRVRNQVWHVWLRYPTRMAVPRIAFFAAKDLLECLYFGALSSWAGGIADAWRMRGNIAGHRTPVSPAVARRAEMHAMRMHVSFVAWMVRHRAIPRLRDRLRPPAPAG